MEFEGIIVAAARTETFKGGEKYKGAKDDSAMRSAKPLTDAIPCGYVEITKSLDGSITNVGAQVPFFGKNDFKIGDEVRFGVRFRAPNLPGPLAHAVKVRHIDVEQSHADEVGTREERDNGWERK